MLSLAKKCAAGLLCVLAVVIATAPAIAYWLGERQYESLFSPRPAGRTEVEDRLYVVRSEELPFREWRAVSPRLDPMAEHCIRYWVLGISRIDVVYDRHWKVLAIHREIEVTPIPPEWV